MRPKPSVSGNPQSVSLVLTADTLLDLTFDPAAALAPLQAFARGRIKAPKAVLGTLRVDDAFCGYEEHEVGLDLAALASA